MGVRIGTVSSVDASGMVAVSYSDLGNTTLPMPVLNQMGVYKKLEPGQKVLVNHLDNGAEGGVVLGCLFNEANIAPVDGQAFPYKMPITMSDVVRILNEQEERIRRLEQEHGYR